MPSPGLSGLELYVLARRVSFELGSARHRAKTMAPRLDPRSHACCLHVAALVLRPQGVAAVHYF